MSACISEFKKIIKFATNLNHKVVSSSTMDIYDHNSKSIKFNYEFLGFCKYKTLTWILDIGAIL